MLRPLFISVVGERVSLAQTGLKLTLHPSLELVILLPQPTNLPEYRLSSSTTLSWLILLKEVSPIRLAPTHNLI